MSSVSVIIPNFNRAAIIGETIENMLSQSLPPKEVIVVDDGSTDQSVPVIRRFGKRVTLLQQPNSGPGAARNAGLKIATGEFIQFIDSDDLASLNKLEAQVQAMQLHGADIVYGPWVRIWKKDNTVRPQNVVLQQQPLPASRTPLCWFLTDWSMVFQQCLVRRTLLQQVGGYCEHLRTFEDGHLFVKLLLAGGTLAHESESLTFYRLDDFGKLTASGTQQSGRMMDEAGFYADIIGLSEKFPVLHPCIIQPHFVLRVWSVLQQLEGQPAKETIAYRQLHQVKGTGSALNLLRHWIRKKSAGMQQLLLGHRWHGCYRTGTLNPHQRKLITDMGWQLIS